VSLKHNDGGYGMSATWDDAEPIRAEQIQALMAAMGFTNQTEWAKVFQVRQQHINRLLNGRAQAIGPIAVLFRWLFLVYHIEGGRAPVPSMRK